MRNNILVVAVLLVGCGGGDDGPPGGGVDAPILGGGCTSSPDNCVGENICINNACVLAFPRVYQVRNIAVTLPTTDPDGAAWDAGGGAPDILVKVSVNGTLTATTATVDDQFSATFAGPFDVMLVGGGSLSVAALDEDITVNDPAVSCGGVISGAQLRNRALSCAPTAALGSISFGITPK